MTLFLFLLKIKISFGEYKNKESKIRENKWIHLNKNVGYIRKKNQSGPLSSFKYSSRLERLTEFNLSCSKYHDIYTRYFLLSFKMQHHDPLLVKPQTLSISLTHNFCYFKNESLSPPNSITKLCSNP